MYVSVSGGFSVPSMVVDSIMSQTTNALGFYTRYFGHMTKHTCMLCEYPGLNKDYAQGRFAQPTQGGLEVHWQESHQ